jgi:hypothetical protein
MTERDATFMKLCGHLMLNYTEQEEFEEELYRVRDNLHGDLTRYNSLSEFYRSPKCPLSVSRLI